MPKRPNVLREDARGLKASPLIIANKSSPIVGAVIEFTSKRGWHYL